MRVRSSRKLQFRLPFSNELTRRASVVRYNHIAAQILLNLITSRGEGVDSLLHSENFRFAMKSLHHLLEACFHTPGLQKVRLPLVIAVIRNLISATGRAVPRLGSDR